MLREDGVASSLDPMPRARSRVRALAPFVAGALPCLLLVVHTALWKSDVDIEHLPASRRYWEDTAVAAAGWLDGQRPTGAPARSIEEAGDHRRQFQRGAIEAGIRPWQFWRTVTVKPRVNSGPIYLRPNDDTGRSLLLGAGFRLLGGVAPFLLLWLGCFAALPVFLWVGWDLAAAGRPVGGLLFLLACSCSPFLVDVLSLPYSGAGFATLAVLGSVGLGAYAALNAQPSLRGTLLRALASGVLLAVCTLCRSGSIVALPGYLLALLVLVVRLDAARRRRGAQPATGRRALMAGAAMLAASVCLVGPFLAVRPTQAHEVWVGVWEGLGDFDRTKGHVFWDATAKRVLREAGFDMPDRAPIWIRVRETEPYFRHLVIGEIFSDPLWYATILGNRFWATLTQIKLLPFGRLDGVSFAPARFENEGCTDTYYTMATTADSIGLLGWRCEVPLPLLWLSPVALLALGVWRALRRHAGLRALASGVPQLFAIVGLSALTFPVFVTTSSALETQTFSLLYFLAFGLLLGGVLRRRRQTVR